MLERAAAASLLERCDRCLMRFSPGVDFALCQFEGFLHRGINNAAKTAMETAGREIATHASAGSVPGATVGVAHE